MESDAIISPGAGAVVEGLAPQERTWGMLGHLLALCGYVIPFGHVVGPLVVYLVKKDESAFVAANAKEALNFQISVTIYLIVAAVLILVVVGIFLIVAIGIAALVFTIVASIKANEGRIYRYPLTIRFIS
jgi:uncharacterized Tic20 family protein